MATVHISAVHIKIKFSGEGTVKHFAVIALGLLLSSCGAKNSVTSILAEAGIMGGKRLKRRAFTPKLS